MPLLLLCICCTLLLLLLLQAVPTCGDTQPKVRGSQWFYCNPANGVAQNPNAPGYPNPSQDVRICLYTAECDMLCMFSSSVKLCLLVSQHNYIVRHTLVQQQQQSCRQQSYALLQYASPRL
jgi:hypothetical protein